MKKKTTISKRLAIGKTKNGEQKRLKGVVAGLRKNRNGLNDKIRKQKNALVKKNGELRNGAEKQVRAEEQIHIRTKAMESAVDGIFIIDAQKQDYPIIYVNQSFQKMTGYQKKEILGQNYFLLYGSEADPQVIEKIKQTIRKEKAYHGETPNYKKDGKKHWNLLRITPVQDARGAITHYVGIQTDVTMMREKQKEIDEQREELLHVTRVGKLAEFVSSLAHEISQPLTSILSYAQAAQRMLADREPKLREILSYIIDDDQRAAEVIHRLRTLLKKSKPDMKQLDINTLINDTVELITTDATVRNVDLKRDFASHLPLVTGDRVQLQQVLLNLISNSFEALESSRDVREISIRTSLQDNDTIRVEVKDTGVGLPVENIPKLFTRFFTSKPDGLGMGLSISRSIIEAHGGRLDVDNNPGSGVTAYFTIPISTKDA